MDANIDSKLELNAFADMIRESVFTMSYLLDEHEMRGLAVLVSKLIARARSYEDRIETIRWRQHDVTQIPLC